METGGELLHINSREGRHQRMGRFGETCREGLCATALSDGKSIAGPVLSDQKIHVSVIEANGAGEKREAEFFVLQLSLRLGDRGDGLAKFALGRIVLSLRGMNLGKAGLRFPAQGRGGNRIVDNPSEAAHGAIKMASSHIQVSSDPVAPTSL